MKQQFENNEKMKEEEEIVIGENCYIDCDKCSECGDLKHCVGVIRESYNDWAGRQGGYDKHLTP